MSDVPSVNQEQPEIPDSESAGKPWVDEVYLQQNPERLPDEPEPTPEEIAAAEAEQAAAEEAKRKEDGQPTKADLKRMIEDLPDDEPEDADAAGKKPDAEAEKAGKADDADKDAAEADKKAENIKDKAGEADDEEENMSRRDRREKERAERIRQVEAENAELRFRLEQQQRGETGEAAPEPSLDDFDDVEEWAEAMRGWANNTINAQKQAEAQTEEVKRKAAEEVEAREKYEAFVDREDKFREDHEDYDAVTRADSLQITPDMAVIIQESELGPQIAYHLGKNPKEAARIAALKNPLAQVKEIGRIEARFEAEQATPNPPAGEAGDKDDDTPAGEATDTGAGQAQPSESAPQQPPRQESTKAPEPISTVGGGGSPARRDPSKMSMEEYEEARMSGKLR